MPSLALLRGLAFFMLTIKVSIFPPLIWHFVFVSVLYFSLDARSSRLDWTPAMSLSRFRLPFLLSVTAAASLLAPLAGRAANSGTVTLPCIADTYVDSSNPTSNYGPSTRIVIDNWHLTETGFVKFDLSGLSGTVTSATLRLHGQYTGTHEECVATVSPATPSTWVENKLNYTNQPTIGPILSYNIVRPIARYSMDYDVTSYVNSQVAGGTPGQVSFAVQMNQHPADKQIAVFNAKESGGIAPELILTFGAPPQVNVNFQPADSTIPATYLADTGEAYDQGLGYGWVLQSGIADSAMYQLDLSGNTFDRGLSYLSPQENTVLYMQYPTDATAYPSDTAERTPGAWEFAVTPGQYSVTTEVGDQPDPVHGYDSVNQINVEGKKIINGFVGSDRQKYKTTSCVATVNDGYLTIDATGGTNTKIDDVTIKPVSVTSPGATNITWGTGANLPCILSETAHVVADSKFYIFGGYRDSTNTPTAGVNVYDTLSNKWSTLPDMPEGLTHAGFVLVGRNVYLAGGYTGKGGSNQTWAITNTWKYNIDSGQWTAFTPLPVARGAGALEYVNGALHYFGGCDINRVDQTTHWMLKLDADGNDAGAGWVQMASIPTAHNHMGCAVLDGKIYAIGGQIGQDAAELPQCVVEVYDPTNDTWGYAAGLPRGRSHIHGSCFTMDNRIIVLGGETDPNTPVADDDVYNPMTNSWTSMTPLPVPHRTGFGDVVNGKLYYGGGGSGNLVLNIGTLQ